MKRDKKVKKEYKSKTERNPLKKVFGKWFDLKKAVKELTEKLNIKE